MIQLFGQSKVIFDEGITEQLPTKAYLIVALLSDKPYGFVRRATLASWLWENSTTQQAFANLRQLLSGIRRFEKKHSIEILKVCKGFVYLNTNIQIDLKDFLSTETLATPQDATQYVSTFAPRLFSELNDVLDEELSTWITSFQKRCDDQFLQLALSGVSSIDEISATACLEKVLAYYPHHEPTCIALIQRYAVSKNWQKIKSVFTTFIHRLKNSFDANPSQLLLTIYARLLPEEITTLEIQFGYLSASRAASLISPDLLPRLVVIPPPSKCGASKCANTFITDVVHSLVQMRCFTILSPSSTPSVVLSGQPLSPLAADFALTILDSSGSKILMVTGIQTGKILFSQTLPFSSTQPPETMYVSFAHSIRKSINNDILKNATDRSIWPAYLLYLSARSKLTFGDLPSIRSTRKKTREALQLFPDFYLAKQMLSHTYYLEWFALGRQDTSLLSNAQKYATQLINSDPTGANGYWQLSIALLYLGDTKVALQNINHAINFAPNNADMLAHKSDILCHLGRKNKALPFINQALRLNPTPPYEYYWIRAGILFLQRKYEEALDDCLRNRIHIPLNLRIIAACYAMLGKKKDATRACLAHLDEYPDFRVSEWKKSFPLQSQNDMQHYTTALQIAGFV